MKKVCIIGIGALGSVVAKNLDEKAELFLVDRDYVEKRNLSRQPFYKKEDVGKTKIDAALVKLKTAKGIMLEINQGTIKNIGKPDLVICCTDSMENKFLVNDYCRKNNLQVIFGSAIQERGMIFVNGESCFRCAFKGSKEESCDLEGIEVETAKKVGEVISSEAIKLLSGKIKPGLIYVNNNEIARINVKKNKYCEVCNKKYIFLKKHIEKITLLCGRTYIIRAKFNFDKINGTRFGYVVHMNGNSFFSDGRAFIKAKSKAEAIRKFNSLTLNQ